KRPLSIDIPEGHATGVVKNTTNSFVITSGSTSAPARYIFACQTGKIVGWNPDVPTAGSTTGVVTASMPAHAYTGLAIGSSGGIGAISRCDMNGNFLGRFVSNGALNAPWGMMITSAAFGPFAGAFIVANAGDGRINAFDASTGAFLGAFNNSAGSPLVIDGLH